MKKYVVEIVEKVVYKVECSDISKEYAEKFARTMYDTGQLEGTGELESVSFDVEEKEESNMKKQIVFVLTELYGNESDTEVNVLGVYTTKTKAKEMLAEKKQKVLESYEQAFCGEYEVSEDHPTLFEITNKNEYIWEQLLITEKEVV